MLTARLKMRMLLISAVTHLIALEKIASSNKALMTKKIDYVESLRSELIAIRKKLYDYTHDNPAGSIDRITVPANLLKRYEGTEFIIREVVKSLEMGRDLTAIEKTLFIHEARFMKIIETRVGDITNWQCYAKGGLEGVVMVRSLIA